MKRVITSHICQKRENFNKFVSINHRPLCMAAQAPYNVPKTFTKTGSN